MEAFVAWETAFKKLSVPCNEQELDMLINNAPPEEQTSVEKEYQEAAATRRRIELSILFYSLCVRKDGVEEDAPFDMNNFIVLTPVKRKKNGQVTPYDSVSQILEDIGLVFTNLREKKDSDQRITSSFVSVGKQRGSPLHPDLREKYCGDYMTKRKVCINELTGRSCSKRHECFTTFTKEEKQLQIAYVLENDHVRFCNSKENSKVNSTVKSMATDEMDHSKLYIEPKKRVRTRRS